MTLQNFQRTITRARKAGLVTLTQMEVLAFIAASPEPVTHRQIFRACNVSTNSGSNLARKLEALEFVTRKVTPAKPGHPEPTVFISISPLGRAWLASTGIE